MSRLMIVESPKKCKSIQSFLGADWIVKSSMGHIRDLPSKEMGVDLETFVPHYVSDGKSKKVLTGLRKLCRSASEVWLATDPDREGEAIAWHLQQALNLDRPFRVSFNEITKRAVNEAVRNPGHINTNLVRAQEGRRVLDRLVGYSVSPILSSVYGKGAWLTAGRVQSAALRLLVERELNIASFKPSDYLEVFLLFETNGICWHAKWQPGKLLPDRQKHWSDKDFADRVAQLKSVTVVTVSNAQHLRRPPPPFITSSLQQAASVTLKMSPKRCMQVAQELYGDGLITYHRTDNPNLSDDGFLNVFEWLSINGLQDDLMEKANRWKSKDNAQEGHEAIRPTSIELTPDLASSRLTTDHLELYRLIWQRTVACQMRPATFNVKSIILESTEHLDGLPMRFEARGKQPIYSGWMKISGHDAADDKCDNSDIQQLPKVVELQSLIACDSEVKQKKTKPLSRYTEASLVKKLEDAGIGRPSTYASIPDTIINRGYAFLKARKFIASDLGILVARAMAGKFHFMEISYTKDIESQLDMVATGRSQYQTVVRNAYQHLANELNIFNGTVPESHDEYACPECGNSLRLIKNRFWGCGGYPDCRYTASNDNGKPGVSKPSRKNKVDNSYPCTCGKGYMQQRQSKEEKFWGCSNFPVCRNTLPDDNGRPGQQFSKY